MRMLKLVGESPKITQTAIVLAIGSFILRTDVIACVPSADKTNTWPRNRRALVSQEICTILQIIITWLMVKHVHNCVREVTPVPGGYRSREDIERLL